MISLLATEIHRNNTERKLNVVNLRKGLYKMKKRCLSEEIFEELSHEESHYKRRSFLRTIPKVFGIRMTKSISVKFGGKKNHISEET